jgi:hypothetical protein
VVIARRSQGRGSMLLAAFILPLAALYLHPLGARPFALSHPKHLRRTTKAPRFTLIVLARNSRQ